MRFHRNPYAILASIRAALIGATIMVVGCEGEKSPASPPIPRELKEQREILQRRARAEQAGDVVAVATINAQLSHEAMVRASRVQKAWMEYRDASTALFPQSLKRPNWNYHNVAADFFCYEMGVAIQTDSPDVPLLRASFVREQALDGADGLCSPVEWDDAKPIPEEHFRRLFGTSEYMKDGLISLYERTGDAAFLTRMTKLADAVIAQSNEASRFGMIPSENSELNGNILQTFSRLTFITGQRRYADMAGRIADAVVEQMFKQSKNLPLMDFDYDKNSFKEDAIRLRDHGNETTVGLSETYSVAVTLQSEPVWSERADRWAEPLARMYETILTKGVDGEGLIVNRMSLKTMEHTNDGACDNWGYLLSGAILYTEAAARHGKLPKERIDNLLALVDEVALSVTKTDGHNWEKGRQDGYADTIESALYVAAARPGIRRELLNWADDQIGYLYQFQRPDGFIEAGYLDGNFMRTTLMYSELRSGRFTLDPWSPTASVGCAVTEDDDAVVVIAGPDGYKGRLLPAGAWYRTRMKLPWDWPRINSWPEWVSSEEGNAGAELNLAPGEKRVFTLAELGAKAVRLP